MVVEIDMEMEKAVKYKKKPVVVDAVFYDGSDASYNDILAMSDDSRRFISPRHTGAWFYITTPEGPVRCSIGSWVIKGVSGEFYPCRDDIFAATFEPVVEEPPLPPDPPLVFAKEAGGYVTSVETPNGVVKMVSWEI